MIADNIYQMFFDNDVCSLSVRNKTHYYNTYTRTSNVVISPDSFAAQNARRMDVRNRCYYQNLESSKYGLHSYVYTLTLNEENLAHYITDDYQPLDPRADVIRGIDIAEFPKAKCMRAIKSMKKEFVRRFGLRMFCFYGVEYGEGGKSHNFAGKRGYGKNPHIHLIFSLTPLCIENGDDIPFTCPSEKQVTEIIKKHWQWTIVKDENTSHGRRVTYNRHADFHNAHLGHVEDDRCKGGKGPVLEGNGRAATEYASKYSSKDTLGQRYLNDYLVRKYWTDVIRAHGICNSSINAYYSYNII